MESRATQNFKKFGINPDGSEATQADHRKILAELRAADNQASASSPAVTRQTTRKAQAPASGNGFLAEVEKLKEEGLSTTDAMKRVARDKPALHADYIGKVNQAKASGPKQRHRFLEACDAIKAETGVPTDRAMGEAIKRHPDLYRDFMNGGR